MFSQWRHAVESLAQPARASQDSSASGEEAPARLSLDSLGNIRTSLSSSSQLAESALSSLRKTLVTQRPISPANAQTATHPSESPTTPTPSPKPRPTTRTTLEDRLRAKFAIGDASNASTPAASSRASPVPASVTDHPLAAPSSRSSTPDIPVVKGPPNPLSPASTPLPDSPIASPSLDPPISLDASVSSVSSSSLPGPLQQQPESKIEAPTPATKSVEGSALSASFAEVRDAASAAEDIREAPQGVFLAETADTDVVKQSPVSMPAQVDDSDTKLEQKEPLPADSSDTAPPGDATLVAHQSADTRQEVLHAVDVPAEEQRPVKTEGNRSMNGDAVELRLDDRPADVSVSAASVDTFANAIVQSEGVVAATETPARSSVDAPSRAATPEVKGSDKADVEALQKRLKLVEERFAAVSTSFKRLQAEKLAADRVLRELTSLESMTEVDALRDFLQNMTLKNEMAQDEIRRLNGKLTRTYPHDPS
ncbi:hypothetical protein BD414DRAFT_102806 [Trametes punicea]|nr:hypothetical protein BD414DRAFT_102806 [Trametes punicea]